jgi:hypothetical protein
VVEKETENKQQAQLVLVVAEHLLALKVLELQVKVMMAVQEVHLFLA